ncbi:Peroxiredoxin [Thioflavicoccus mobilis 8321]|uniref:thioredoxin-dependent peroxiredoxin n=1 Tax=Thioflavicoccus mobilis 8321 TaxID=765912 RepID=L0GT45_9GAMM|nr:peroxiredoxin [Thioflavicoccus mobilis]AGA88967.1 Peroxiredoxin [Thioflavicoccus mobilis 8321]
MLQPGDQTPLFSLPDADMARIDLARLLATGHVVVYFYPKDDTPGCTLEALEFTDLQSDFEALQTEILGVSRDSCVSHGAFRDRHGIGVRLLADSDGEVCDAFDVWREKEVRGEKRHGIVRSTFVIDRRGVIRHALYDVKPKGHARQVLELVRGL